MNIALLIAGGTGNRMGQEIPKQFINVLDKPVIIYTLEAFQKHPEIDSIYVVCIDGWHEMLWSYARQFGISKLDKIVSGGECGQESIRNGVLAIAESYSNADDIVLVHDAIRPMVSAKIISDNLAVCKKYRNAITSIPCQEAMLVSEDGISSTKNILRSTLKRTQTPQSFYVNDLKKLHEKALEYGITNSIASCTLMIELGEKVYFSDGSEKNIKLTTTDDLEIFKALINQKPSEWIKRGEK